MEVNEVENKQIEPKVSSLKQYTTDNSLVRLVKQWGEQKLPVSGMKTETAPQTLQAFKWKQVDTIIIWFCTNKFKIEIKW